MSLFVEQLSEKDRVSIAVYAGASGLVLPPTPGDDHRAIIGALDQLEAGGSTNGGAGIELACDLAGEGQGRDHHGYRAEFIELLNKARSMD